MDRLTERLLENLERLGDRPSGPDCVGLDVLARLATGVLEPQARERVEAHLNQCLTCLHRFVALRDDLQVLTEVSEVSPRLMRTLDTLAGAAPSPSLVDRVRRAFVFRVPAWSLAAVAAVLLLTWVAVDRLPRSHTPKPVAVGEPIDRLDPAHAQFQRTVSGTVSAVRDATSNGVEAHIVDVRDASGTTYLLFAWGRPPVRPGDKVEVDGIFTSGAQAASGATYQGLATAFRKAR